MSFRGRCALVASLVLSLATSVAAQINIVLRVDRDATGAGDGTSWADAFTDLQVAIEAGRLYTSSTGWWVQLWVAEGSYAPAGPGGPRTATFLLPYQVALYGGFGGDEEFFVQRDPLAHATVLTGDLLGDDLPGGLNRADNVYHVLTADNVYPSSVVDGFTVHGGQADDPQGGHDLGGGLLALNSSPTVLGCTFTDNRAGSGGAIAIGRHYWEHEASIRGCTFEDNHALSGCGGALYVLDVAWLDVDACRFVGNRSSGGPAARGGGAVFIEAGAKVLVRDSRFVDNADLTPGDTGRGGALCNQSDTLRLEACAFAGNAAALGGAVWNSGDITLSHATFSANTAGLGGGLLLDGARATLAGCTFHGNMAADGGGVASLGSPLVLVRNTILWGNVAPGQPVASAQWHDLGGAVSQFGWCTVQGLFDSPPGDSPPALRDFPGCLDADPLLSDPAGPDGLPGTADDDLSLAPGSPARDAGRNDFVTPGLLEDLAGAARFHDDPLAPDGGFGAPPLVDMGALEGDAPVTWVVLGGASPYENGVSELRGSGPLTPGSAGLLRLSHYYQGNFALLCVATAVGAAPFKGGLLVAWPPELLASYWLDLGDTVTPWTDWPAGTSGMTLVIQYALFDYSALHQVTLSNGLLALPP